MNYSELGIKGIKGVSNPIRVKVTHKGGKTHPLTFDRCNGLQLFSISTYEVMG